MQQKKSCRVSHKEMLRHRLLPVSEVSETCQEQAATGVPVFPLSSEGLHNTQIVTHGRHRKSTVEKGCVCIKAH